MRYVRRPDILRSIVSHQHGVIEASAGTGKTWTLERLFVDLIIEEGMSFDEILVVTFTEKATREMRQRIRATLASIVFGRGDFTPVKDTEASEAPERYWAIDDALHRRLRSELIAFDRAPIMTIHGFCQRVAQDFAFRSGRAFDFELVDGQASFERAFYEEVRRQLSQDSFVSSLLNSALAELGAKRLARVLYEWCTPNASIYPVWDPVAFRHAAEAKWDLSALRAAVEASPLRKDTGGRVLQLCRELAEVAQSVSQDEDVSRSLVLLHEFRNRPVTKQERAGTWLPAKLARVDAQEFCQSALQLLYSPQPLGVLIQTFLPLLQARMIRDKERRAQVDFDDMLRVVKDALDGPYGDSLRDALRATYRTGLVDEFQDTDPVQWSIFRQIFVDETPAHRLFVIGDPKQAIYGFRGADVETYLKARNHLSDSPVHLRTCYRSSAPLISAFNTIFEAGFFRGSVQYDNPVESPEAQVSSQESDPCVVMRAPTAPPTGKAPSVDRMRRMVIETVASEVAALMEGKAAGYPKVVSPKDIFVLTRTADEAVLVSEVMRTRGISTMVTHREGLFDGDAAADVLDVLRAIASPDDLGLRLAAFLTPFFGLSLGDIKEGAHLGTTHPWYRLLIRLHRLSERRTYNELWRTLLTETRLVTSELFGSDGERRLTDYIHLLDLAAEGSGSVDFAEIVSRFEMRVLGTTLSDSEMQRAENARDAVQVMTMHKAKGLEAEVVFVAGGFSRGRSDLYSPNRCHGVDEYGEPETQAWLRPVPDPIAQSILAERRSEDERLLYVALTRAVSRVYIPYFPNESKFKVRGPLAVLNQRLQSLEQSKQLSSAPFSELKCIDVKRRAEEAQIERCKNALSVLPSFVATTEHAQFESLKTQRAGYLLTSYSRLAAGKVSTDIEEQERSHEGATVEAVQSQVMLSDSQMASFRRAASLPGGASVGIFLHEIIENVDWAILREASSAQVWFERSEVALEFGRTATRNGVSSDQLPDWAEVIFNSLRTSQRVQDVELQHGFSQLTEVFAEMPFMFSIPETAHPLLGGHGGAKGGRPFRIERGVFRGVIDLVFRENGKWFFLDWKSDRLAPENHGVLSSEAMANHVAEHYGLQAKLYTLAVVRMFDIRNAEDYDARFGGLAYCFLRGMQSDHKGVYSERPSFDQVVAWEQELAESDEPFGYALNPGRHV